MTSTPVRDDNIFVVGCQRSGTSVVYACLVAHPELTPRRGYDPATGYDPKELYYFRNIFAARRQFPSPMYGWNVDREYLRQLVQFTVRFCAEQHGAASGRWVNAHPADALYIADILESMPAVRVVMVLRHPQEVVWSALHAPWARAKSGTIAERAAQGARHWAAFAKVALDVLRGSFGRSVLLVRHEDLLRDPERLAKDITAHVGVPYHPSVCEQLAAPTFNSSFQNQASPRELIESTRRKIAAHRAFCREVVRQVGAEMEALSYRDLSVPRRRRWLAWSGR